MIMKKLLLIVSAFLLLQTAAFAQGAIDGRVLNAKTAAGVANITVNVIGPDGKIVATVKTDETGSFTVEDLEEGIYRISVRGVNGFLPFELGNIKVEDEEAATVLVKLSAMVPAAAVASQGGGTTQPVKKPAPQSSGCGSGSASIVPQFSIVNASWVKGFNGYPALTKGKPFMQKGIVKFFNECKGFGIIKEANNGPEFFVNRSGLKEKIRTGDTVVFSVHQSAKGPMAVEVRLAT